MKAEKLIGKTLGTCTLQKLIGQGGMGAVYLAQQSRPRRLVAVKVLLPMFPLNDYQFAAFLERFRRETDAAASLEHPNIIPVHEYGEQDGIVYLVMPYINGGTLRDELEHAGPLSLQKTLDYIEQLAVALDFAHEHGVIHRDIKPANIMATPEGRLLLTDFGLVKIIAEGQKPQVRLTGAGAPVGTPDYMAPEQVIGDEVDTRADLYSLGVILFQMLTGTTPFRGETPMQIAAQHLQIPPPSPQMLRPDLPIAVEQVVLRSLAKKPANRYRYAQDMANALRSALLRSGIEVETTSTHAGLISGTTASRLAVPKGQFDPLRQTASMPRIKAQKAQPPRAPETAPIKKNNTLPPIQKDQIRSTKILPPPINPGERLLARGATQVPGQQQPKRQTDQFKPTGNGAGLLSKTGQFPRIGTGTIPTVAPGSKTQGHTGLLSKTGRFPLAGSDVAPITAETKAAQAPRRAPWIQDPLTPQAPTPMPPPLENNRQMVPVTDQQPNRQIMPITDQQPRQTTMTLNDPVKVVKVPVAGQPGQFVTGILPFVQQPEPIEQKRKILLTHPGHKYILAVICVFVLLGTFGSFLLLQPNHAPTPAQQETNTTTSNADTNIIFSDPLTRNAHGWNDNPQQGFQFKDGAYHISASDNTDNGTYLPGIALPATFGYTLTMQEVQGDDTSKYNAFGMIFRFTQVKNGNSTNTKFYAFEVVNSNKGGEYQFWLFNDSNKTPWKLINNGELPFGKEYHEGQGPKASNTIKVFMNGNQFTVTVNGIQLSRIFQDNTLTSGAVGMLVNQKGTEVAFKNLLLTNN